MRNECVPSRTLGNTGSLTVGAAAAAIEVSDQELEAAT